MKKTLLLLLAALMISVNPSAQARSGFAITSDVTVDTPYSAISTLSALTMSSGTLSPTFATGILAYTSSVANATNTITVSSTVTDPTATIKLNGVSATSGTASDSIPLAVGTNTITVLVTAQDGSTQSSYTVTVTRISTVSTLSGLALSTGALSPAFASGINDYTTSVASAITALTVTPTLADTTAAAKVDGTSVASGFASEPISLVVGTNTITVLITAQDGSTTSTYTVTITRPPSAVSTLDGLTLSSGTLSPTFTSTTKVYAASVTHATNTLTVIPTVSDATATVTVNDTPVASGTASVFIPLVVGTNPITVLVTAQDGTTTSSYTIIVTRSPSAVSTLSGLTLSSGTLSPAFASGTLIYTSSVANATTGVAITPTITDATSTVRVNGTPVASGTASASIPLVVGANPITVLVTAEDGTTTSTYTVTLTRISTVSTLSSLALSVGNLSPVFSTGTTAYTTSVPNAASSMTVTPIVTDATATIQVNGTAVASGSASASIPLVVGNNTITILVTAQDGTTTSTYTITVNRISTVATLSGLVMSAGTLSPIFASGTKVYTFSVANGVTGLTVSPTLTNSFATVTVNGAAATSGAASSSIPLVVGANPITLLVTAQDGVTTSTYTVTVTRISTVSTLSGLALSVGTLSPVFATGTLAYTTSVPNAINSMTVTSAVSDATETIKVNGITVVSGVASASIPLVVGNNPIAVLVTAQDGTTTSIYTVTVNRISTVSTLSGLALSAGTLSPTFVSGTKVYSTSVANIISSITVTPTVTDSTATITVNGTQVISGTPSAAVPLAVGNNPITVLVTAQDGTTTSTYTVTVNRISTVSTLSGLVLSSGTLSPTFASGTYIYTASVANAISALTLTPTLTNSFATVTVNGTAVTSGSTSASIPLVVGNNTITVLGTAQDGTTTSFYTITVNRISTVSTLSGLAISSGTLSPTFGSGTKVYSVSVANAISGMTVTPTVTDSTATVTINGTPVTPGTASASIPLVVGTNLITVLVTAQDGTTTSSYTVTVTRISTVSTLSGLLLSSGTLSPNFASGTNVYTASVANGVTGLTMTPTLTNSFAAVTVNGTAVTSGTASASIPLSIGDNTIALVVTAQDGTTTSTYTVTVNRISTVSTLSGLVLSSGTLSPAFASGTKTYTASVPNAITGLTVTPTLTNSFAEVTVNGTGVSSGNASTSIPLTVGTNIITAVVTAQDGTTTSTYTVTVTRISAVSTLSGLALSVGTLSPVFAPGTTAYRTSVPNAASSMTVTPTVTDATATVKVNGTTVVSGSASASISLVVGNNTITILVTAQDGTTTSTYTVAVNRISAVATLSGLIISAGTLSPIFASNTKVYSASVPNAITGLTVTPTLTNSFAAVTVNGTSVSSGSASSSIPLVVGSNSITVLVTAQDGVTISTYAVTVTRFSTVSTLSALSLSSGTLSPTYAPGKPAYTSSVSNATSSITVTPSATSSAATVKVNGVSVASGTASAAIPLAVGTNVITVLVTAQDSSFTSSYTVTVTRPVLVAPSFTSATSVPLTLANITTPANVVTLSLGYAPIVGTNLTLVENTGLSFITGRFSNLTQGQVITLGYHNASYRFVVNYYGGTGNDLVLQWANDKSYAWGSDSYGQLGDSGVAGPSSNVPVAVTYSGVLSGKTILSISTGSSHSLALCADGTVAAWGRNTYGQLGNAGNTDSSIPMEVTQSGVLAGKTVVAVSAGFYHSLALCSDGTVACWGYNLYGQLGNGTTTSSNVPVLVTTSGVLSGKVVTSVVAGYYHNLALCADGAVVAWGRNNSGQLGNNSSTDSSLPVNISTSGTLNGRSAITVAAGSDHSLVLCLDGSLVSWGKNANGQLGNGSTTGSLIPQDVDATDVLAGRIVEMISAGGFHNLVTCSDGTLVTFGRNTNGQLGNGGNTDSTMPVAVTLTGTLNGKTVTAIQAANAHSLALCSDGSIASWGSGSNGLLGNGGIANSSVPVAVTASGIGSGEKFIALANGPSASHSMALTAIPLSSVSTLASLTLSYGTLSPTFSAGALSYTTSVPSTTPSISLTPTVTDATATVTVNDATVASGSSSGSIPLVVGSNTINVVVIPQDGGTLTTYTVAVTRAGTFDLWRSAVFTNPTDLANPMISGELATPANDGISNVMKYSMALNPMTSAAGNLPTSSRQAGYLTLTYRKSKTASDVTYTVQAADTLSGNTWAPATNVLSQTDPAPGGGSYWLVTVRDNVPFATHPQRYMRLQVVK